MDRSGDAEAPDTDTGGSAPEDPNLRDPGAGEPAVPSIERKFTVPAYKKEKVAQIVMNSFMAHHADTDPNMFNALGEIFAAEGGFEKDPTPGSTAYAGITGPALKDAMK